MLAKYVLNLFDVAPPLGVSYLEELVQGGAVPATAAAIVDQDSELQVSYMYIFLDKTVLILCTHIR